MPLKESFEWAPPGIAQIPKGNLLKLIAKTEATTYHPQDPEYPVRKFTAKELERAARTLIGRPLGSNHEAMPIYGAYILDSEYANEEVQSIAYAPTAWVDKVRAGLIGRCSIEYTWRGEKRNGGVEFEGLVFTRVDLLEGLKPGDKGSAVTLYEALDKDTHTGAFLTKVIAVEQEPIAPTPLTDEEIAAICKHYSITREQYDADPAKYPKPTAAAEQDPPKADVPKTDIERACAHYGITPEEYLAFPDQYPLPPAGAGRAAEPAAPAAPVVKPLTPEEIAAICTHYSITPEEYAANPEKYPKPESVKVSPADAKRLGEPFAGYANFDACVAANQDQADPQAYCAAIQAKAEPAAERIKTLEEAFKRITAELQIVKTSQDARIHDAKTFAHLELKTAVEAVMPKSGFLKDHRINRLLHDIKDVLNEPIQTT